MDENIFDKDGFDAIKDVDLKQTMETSYIDYAMSVIASRALPDVRDGMKPVQRRILYAMIELNNGPDKPHRKCARIVGDTMGKYHPHGDSSIYGALVNLAQEWSTRYPLVDGHGNFGSVDGDGAAAMRYTEARLSKISMEMLSDINKDTVDFMPNFDETEKEPVVLPSRFPNLLVNGTSGIAVGMATNIPPHNLTESINGVVKIIDNQIEEDRDTTLEEIMEIIKGPDFPTGATILGRRGIEEAYRTGHGKIRVRAVTDIEPMNNGKNRIVVTELPYMVNKARLIEKIAELHKDKRIDGITEIRDESSREGMRVVIELRKDVNANVVLNQLYKHTQMQDTFGVNMLALVNNEPVVMNLLQMLEYYLKHEKPPVMGWTPDCKYPVVYGERGRAVIEISAKEKQVDEFFLFINNYFLNANTNAEKLGLDFKDEEFGINEMRNFVLKHEKSKLVFSVTFSYPANMTLETIVETIREKAKNMEVTCVQHYFPVKFEKDCPMVSLLSKAYEKITHLDGTPVTTTGGTYAKLMPHIVPFGPSFPGQKGIGHQPNEWMKIEDLNTNAKIYALGIYYLGML